MRREDKEITDMAKILKVLDSCTVCRLGIYDPTNEEAYIVPMNFAYQMKEGKLFLYFHSARRGRKIDLLARCLRVTFEMDCGHQLIPHDRPCEYSYRYSCIMGTGTVSFLSDPHEKAAVLSLLMKKMTGRNFVIEEKTTPSVSVFYVEVRQFSCKAQN